MFNLKNILILAFSIFILFLALRSSTILPNVVLSFRDTIIILFFILITDIVVHLKNMIEVKRMKEINIIKNIQMNTIIDNIPFVLYLKDTKGTILAVNQAFATFKNKPKECFIGTNIINLYSDENAKITQKEDNIIIKNKKSFEVERTVKSKNGEVKWYRIMKSPICDKFGNVVNILVIYRNIDSEKEIEDRKKTFIATLTHDLKTPTISQIKALNLLLNNTFGTLNEPQKNIVTQIKNSCKYMYDLIFKILDTYLYDNGQTKINSENFDLCELISETIGEISNLLIEKQQTITINTSLKSNIINADRFQIKRVILNIISNAITYGFVDSNIEIELSEDKTNTKLDITNHSKYISEEKLKDIFQKYKTQTNAKFRETSTGLGLYLSKQIIEAHRGEIHAKSHKDETCTFGFSLPKKVGKILKNKK